MLDRESLIEIASGERPGLIPWLLRGTLWCLSQVYGVVIRFRNRKYDALKNVTRVEVPVISVGNLTTGGTGKSPMVIWLARFLRQQNLRVAVLSRGYGAKGDQTSDEALELEQRLDDVPHLQNPDRIAAAEIAIEELEMQALLLDDAFQHRRIARNLDLVLIDCTRPFGFGYLLPRGLLREPLSGLARADAILLSRCEQVTESEITEIEKRIRTHTPCPIAKIQSKASHLLQANGQTKSIESLSHQRAYAFCGIGNAENFWSTLEQIGLDVRGKMPFPDHHNYDREDINRIGNTAKRSQADFLVCTHKDLVKIGVNEIHEVPVFALVVDVDFIEGESELTTLIQQKIK